jgi:aspartate dehydrogenase
MTRVAVVGTGAIGSVVIDALEKGRVLGARLTAVIGLGDSLECVLADADVVVECAGQGALAELGPRVIAAGRDLLAVSIGALANDALHDRLRGGPGRLILTSGAVGGLDLLRAAAAMAPLEKVQIITTKKPAALGVPPGTHPVEVMRGPARQVATAFPRSANVAAAVALAVGSFEVVEAVVVADPAATRTSHVISASGPAGDYRFEIRNRPSPANPASSQVVPHAVLATLQDLVR